MVYVWVCGWPVVSRDNWSRTFEHGSIATSIIAVSIYNYTVGCCNCGRSSRCSPLVAKLQTAFANYPQPASIVPTSYAAKPMYIELLLVADRYNKWPDCNYNPHSIAIIHYLQHFAENNLLRVAAGSLFCCCGNRKSKVLVLSGS